MLGDGQDIQRLLAAFDSRTLVRPDWRRPSSMDLVACLYRMCGVADLPETPGVAHVANLVGPADHVVFVLVDALGLNILERMPADTFLRQHLAAELGAIFPSTTASVLTSLATAQWPNSHAVTGWWTHLAELGFTATILQWIDRFTHESMSSRGLHPPDVLPAPSVFTRLRRRSLVLVPRSFAESPYSIYWRGGTAGRGTHSIDDGIDMAIEHVNASSEPSFTYLYLPEVDTLIHHRGYDHRDVVALALLVDAEMQRLAARTAGRARIIITADHGQTNVPVEDRLVLRDKDPILGLLQVPPSGGAPLPLFHVRPGAHEAFERAFHERFSAQFALISIEQAETLELFGPGPILPLARRRFGDYVGVPLRPATLKFYTRGTLPEMDYLGVHGSLLPDEMRIPLVIA